MEDEERKNDLLNVDIGRKLPILMINVTLDGPQYFARSRRLVGDVDTSKMRSKSFMTTECLIRDMCSFINISLPAYVVASLCAKASVDPGITKFRLPV